MTLKKALEEIDNEFGPGACDYLGADYPPVEAISTGCLGLDIALGIGGVPRGRMVEIFGPESAGKSTLTYHIITEAQKQSGTCALIDTEHSFDPKYAQAIGMDTEGLIVSQPDYGEQGMEIVDQLVKSNEVDVIAVDSVAALTPRAELEGQMGDAHVGLLARLMSQGLRKLTKNLAKSRTALVFTNQIREKVGIQGFGPQETQPGGRALRFYAAQRIDIRRIETMRGPNKEAVGIKCKAKVIKNKTAPPFKEALFEIDYGRGISNEAAILAAAQDAGLLKKNGSHITFNDIKLGNGKHAAKEFLRENPDRLDEIQAALPQPKERL